MLNLTRLYAFLLLCFAAALANPVRADMSPGYAVPLPGSIQGTNAIRTCGPFVGTLANVGDFVQTVNCEGASNYLITITTPSGQSKLVGTIASTDATTGGTRRLVKTGVGALEIATEALPGTQPDLEYRTVGGAYGQKITLTAKTSGQAYVTIMGLYDPTTVFINGAVHNSEEVAIRGGRSFTASTGLQSLSASQSLSIQYVNPPTSNMRTFITTRAFGCNYTGTTPLELAGVSNPTTNLATTAATVTNRRTGGQASVATVTYGMAATHPDTNPAAANPVGAFVPNNGSSVYLGVEYMRTVEPGTSFTNWITAPSGLGASARCYITYLWYEEPIN